MYPVVFFTLCNLDTIIHPSAMGILESYLIRLPVNILWQKYKRDQTLLQTNLHLFVPGVCISSSYYLQGKLFHIASLIAETKTTSHEVE